MKEISAQHTSSSAFSPHTSLWSMLLLLSRSTVSMACTSMLMLHDTVSVRPHDPVPVRRAAPRPGPYYLL